MDDDDGFEPHGSLSEDDESIEVAPATTPNKAFFLEHAARDTLDALHGAEQLFRAVGIVVAAESVAAIADVLSRQLDNIDAMHNDVREGSSGEQAQRESPAFPRST